MPTTSPWRHDAISPSATSVWRGSLTLSCHVHAAQPYSLPLQSICEERIRRAQTITDLCRAFGSNRYHKVNIEAYTRYSAVEFRQHGGTTNFAKMSTWIHFLEKMITFATATVVNPRTSLDGFPFLTETEKLYFRLRTRKLAAWHEHNRNNLPAERWRNHQRHLSLRLRPSTSWR